jgi:ABC-type glycerol-3-phosphate transport system substrate-binding protein
MLMKIKREYIVMKPIKLLVIAAVALALSACGGSSTDSTDSNASVSGVAVPTKVEVIPDS